MKKGMPLRIIFVVVLSQNEVHLGYFAGITMKKNYILTALNDLSLRLICFQQVSLICDLTTKLWRKRISSQKQKIRKNQVRKSPKSDIKLACFDILWYIIKINQLFYFSSKMPTYLYFFAFCVPKCQPVWRPKHLQKRKQIVCPNYPPIAPNFKTELPISFEEKIEDSLSKIKEKLELKCPSVLIR